MSRFQIFGGASYYPHGGWSDFLTDVVNYPTAIELAGVVYEQLAVDNGADGAWVHVSYTLMHKIVWEIESD